MLANSLAAYDLWKDSVAMLLEPFSQDVKDGLQAGPADPAKYREAMDKFYGVHGCIIRPFPEEFLYSMDQNHAPDADRTVTSSG